MKLKLVAGLGSVVVRTSKARYGGNCVVDWDINIFLWFLFFLLLKKEFAERMSTVFTPPDKLAVSIGEGTESLPYSFRKSSMRDIFSCCRSCLDETLEIVELELDKELDLRFRCVVLGIIFKNFVS